MNRGAILYYNYYRKKKKYIESEGGKMKVDRYFYLVVGIEEDDQGRSTLILSDSHALQTSKEKAIAELGAILDEIRNDADEMGYEFQYVMGDENLTVDYESGSQEFYTIRKVKLN